MFQTELQAIELKIRSFCTENGLPEPGSIEWTPIPFSGTWGMSTSVFQLAADDARLLKKRTGQSTNVPQHAQDIAQKIVTYLGTLMGFTRVEAIKGYLNLYFSPEVFADRVVKTAIGQAKSFGNGNSKGERVMVEFSNPNTHKAFHVGHLRGAILGDALCRILEFAGYDVVRVNYVGDIGLHVIKWLWNYMKYHRGEKPTQDITRWMGDIYAEAVRRLEENSNLEPEVRELYARWDRRDPEVVNTWRETRQWSFDGFNKLYDILDIRFERDYSNSEAEKPGQDVVNELIEKGIAIDERSTGGAVIVRIDELLGLTKEKYRVLVILRSDGTALYATEDLALAKIKFSEYDLARSLYVVDVRQSLHFQQVFKTLEIAGYPWASKCQHLPFEVVILPGNVILSSREGAVVLLEDLLREAVQRALDVVRQKNPALNDEQMQAVAKAVGIGALKFPMLSRENTKTVTFDWKTALDFNGQAAPYIQYAHVRCNSILRKAQVDGLTSSVGCSPFTYELDPKEIQLIDQISRLPGEVQRAAEEYKPLMITNLAFELARAFNDFYDACPVLKADPEIRKARLQLVKAAKQAIANTLALLGITAPEVM
jgi:arginyl-tRNA synthetase